MDPDDTSASHRGPVSVGKHLGYLDGWRGLAIGFLLIGHFFPVPGINLGTFGVNFFFVLSGWLMTRLLFIQHTPIPLFYKRRTSRIFPTHFAFIGLTVVAYFVAGREINWAEVGATTIFLNNYFPGDLGNTVMPFGHIWSLSVEEHSYILLSSIAVMSRRKAVDPLLAIGFFCAVFACMGIWYWTRFSGDELVFGKWIHTEVSAFGIFISAFFVLLFTRIRVPKPSLIVYLTLALIAIAMHWWSVPSPLRTILGVGSLALLVNLLGEAPPFVKSTLSFAPLRWLGTWSFSIYIWQQPFYLYAHSSANPPIWVAFVLAICCGLIFFYLVEKPVRNYLNSGWASQ